MSSHSSFSQLNRSPSGLDNPDGLNFNNMPLSDKSKISDYFKVYDGFVEQLNSSARTLKRNFDYMMGYYDTVDRKYNVELSNTQDPEKRLHLIKASFENDNNKSQFIEEYQTRIEQLDRTRRRQEAINKSRINSAIKRKREFGEINLLKNGQSQTTNEEYEDYEEENQQEMEQQRKRIKVKQEAAKANNRKSNM